MNDTYTCLECSGRCNALGATRPKPRQADASLTADISPLNPLKGTSPLPSPGERGFLSSLRRVFTSSRVYYHGAINF